MTIQNIAALAEATAQPRHASTLYRVIDAVGYAVHRYMEWRTRRATIRVLEALDNRMLHDIGLTRSEIHSVVYGGSAERRHRFQSTRH